MYKLMFNDNASKVMTDDISDMIRKYTLDGYKIDCKESAVDPDSDVDKDCTFKVVLKKDIDGIECKTIIRLLEEKTAIGKSTTLSKVEYVGDTKWSAESHSYSHSYTCPAKDDSDTDISAWDRYKSSKSFTRLSDVIKVPNKDEDDFTTKPFYRLNDKKDDDDSTTKWKCKCPSAFHRLDDYIKFNDKKDDMNMKIKFTTPDGKEAEAVDLHDKNIRVEKDNSIEGDGTVHIKVNKDDSMDDLYNKITNKYSKGLDKAGEAKLRKDTDNKKKVPIESLYDKKDDDSDTLEDSLLTLVKFLFGK